MKNEAPARSAEMNDAEIDTVAGGYGDFIRMDPDGNIYYPTGNGPKK